MVRIDYEEDLREQKALTEAFQRTFSGPYGEIVLTHLLNRLGFFATDPNAIKPENMAVANWILMNLGTYSTDAKLQTYVGGLVKIAKGEVNA